MTRSNAAHEPSMDEILASIRRIIETGDETPATMGPQVQRYSEAEGGEPQVIARLSPQEDAAYAWNTPVAEPDVVPAAAGEDFAFEDELAAHLHHEFEKEDLVDWSNLGAGGESATAHDAGLSAQYENEAMVQAEDERPAFQPANSDSRRLNDYRAAVLDDDLERRLPDEAGSLTSERTGELVGASFGELAEAIREGHMRSLEEMAQEMLRPMLTDWLDDNLPKLVERLVREEIERVARGTRR